MRTSGPRRLLTSFNRIVDCGYTNLGEPQSPCYVHSRDDMLMLGVCIGTDGQRQIISTTRDFL
jgi:hypothetical protein